MNDVGYTIENQKHPKYSRNETGSIHQLSKWEKPKAPEHFQDNRYILIDLEKQHSQILSLIGVKCFQNLPFKK